MARILIDTSVQMFFPFLPLFAQGLGISAVAMGRLVSVRSIMGLFAPSVSAQTDRRGYRLMLQFGLVSAGFGYLLIGLSSNMWLAIIGMILAGLGSFSFIPILQAYLSTYLPYDRRARGLGTVELGWALSGIFGLLLVGELIERTSWRMPLIIIGVGLLLMSVIYIMLPSPAVEETAPRKVSHRPRWERIKQYADLGQGGCSAWWAIVVNGVIMLAVMHTFISYGSWLVADYELSASELGRVALLMGISDLLGISLVALVSDRFGKRRTFIAATACGFFGFLGLFWIGGISLFAALAGLLFARFTFEVGLVSLIPLLSEQIPDQRSKVMALGSTSALIGTTISGFTGPWAYSQFGLMGLAVPSAVMMMASCLIVLFGVKESPNSAEVSVSNTFSREETPPI